MTQKELKAQYTAELEKAWSSEKMIKFCSKECDEVIEYNGLLFSIDKPKIQKDFCFGYGFCGGISDEEDEQRANAAARRAQESTEYFINENLKPIDEWLETLNNILEEMGHNWAEGSKPRYMIATGPQYHGQKPDCKLRGYTVEDTAKPRSYYSYELCNDEEFIKKLINGYEEVKQRFVKRLNSYLKRYGLSKVNSWSYLVD